MKKNLVSIVTPCYNGEYFIRRFLKSILNQTYSIAILLISANSRCVEPPFAIVRTYCF